MVTLALPVCQGQAFALHAESLSCTTCAHKDKDFTPVPMSGAARHSGATRSVALSNQHCRFIPQRELFFFPALYSAILQAYCLHPDLTTARGLPRAEEHA